MIKPNDMKLNTWYKSGNIMMYPYARTNEKDIYTYNGTYVGESFSMMTFQVITHWGPKRWEYENTDEWQIHIDEDWKRSNTDSHTYKRDYLYWDEKEWVIEDEDIEIPAINDFKKLIHAIFTYQKGYY